MQVLLRKRSTASKTAAISFAMKATLCLALVGIASASFIRSGSEARNNLAAGNNNASFVSLFQLISFACDFQSRARIQRQPTTKKMKHLLNL
mmetsp:Transcript_86435/g.175717  ORF Transcript_86435/g.175717 Transcript_86435/m.175717 type:complete len:92 (-) Transcript_86435:624-899(-)